MLNTLYILMWAATLSPAILTGFVFYHIRAGFLFGYNIGHALNRKTL